MSAADWNTFNGKQTALPTGGTTAQYLRGDYTLATFNASALGLGNVDNVPSQLTVKTYADAKVADAINSGTTYYHSTFSERRLRRTGHGKWT